MPVFVGPGSASDGGFEGKSDRVGLNTATSDPSPAVVGDMYMQTVGAGATVRLYDGTEWADYIKKVVGLVVTGGTEYESGDYRWHVITNSSPAPQREINITRLWGDANDVIDFLVVGGGGGAGAGDNSYGGCGGGGGVVFSPAKQVGITGPHPITIGTGGAGTPLDNSDPGVFNNGGNTSVGPPSANPLYLVAFGGGAGAHAAGYSFGTVGQDGGSGGGGAGGGPGPRSGGSATQPGAPGDSGTYGHGNAGGSGGGGGGGGGGAGTGYSGNADGGNGYQVPTTFLPTGLPAPMATQISPFTTSSPEWRYFGAGGGLSNGGDGGLGGAGDGFGSDGLSSAPAASQAVDHRGSGGGAGVSNNPHAYAGDGSDGIVIFRYKFQ